MVRHPIGAIASGLVVLSAACAASAPEAPRPRATAPVPSAPPAALAARACAPAAGVPPLERAQDGEASEASGRKKVPSSAAGVCEVADSNIARAQAAIVQRQGLAAPVPPKPWDRRSPPRHMDRVAARLALTEAERALLAKNGFVVTTRDDAPSYAWMFHEIYQSELPVYVSADAILHAVFVSNDHALATVERAELVGRLDGVLAAMHCALPAMVAELPREVALDVDVYLTVSRSLLAGAPVASVLGVDAEAAELVRDAGLARDMKPVALFGRDRMIDFTQYRPRGRYAGDEVLGRYFRAAMWLSRLELNLVSRSSRSSQPGVAPNPEETPREANDALALAFLAERAGVVEDVDRLDRAWELLAGRREDVGLRALLALAKGARIATIDATSPPKLRAAIGGSFVRTARLHYMPEGSKDLPVIATMLGPRVTPDTAALRPLAHSEVPGRHMVTASDVAYALGHDRAKVHLAADLAAHPKLAAGLTSARDTLAARPRSGSLYDAWLDAVTGLARRPAGDLPSFMSTPAFADLRVSSAVAGYGQLRHNYVLMAGQEYSEGGCEIPDGWVEPVPEVYRAIVAYAARGAAVVRELDPKDVHAIAAYFAELGKNASVLAAIADDELAGRPLSEPARQFLSMIVEMSPATTGGPPTYTGWYFDMFRTRDEGLADAAFVSDYFTSGQLSRAAYAGASPPRMGVFVVDTAGPPRVVVGPVAHAWELDGPIDERLTDETAKEAPGKRSPWETSYAAPAPSPVPIGLSGDLSQSRRSVSLRIASTRALRAVTLELLDHHRRGLATRTVAVPAGKVARVDFALAASRVEAVRVKVGEWSTVAFKGYVGESVWLEVGGATAPEP